MRSLGSHDRVGLLRRTGSKSRVARLSKDRLLQLWPLCRKPTDLPVAVRNGPFFWTGKWGKQTPNATSTEKAQETKSPYLIYTRHARVQPEATPTRPAHRRHLSTCQFLPAPVPHSQPPPPLCPRAHRGPHCARGSAATERPSASATSCAIESCAAT